MAHVPTLAPAVAEAPMSKLQRVLLISAASAYSVLVFVLDVISPLGIEVWVLNLPVILVPVPFGKPRLVVFFSLASSAMLVLGGVLSPPGYNPTSWDILNRTMGLATIGLIAVVAVNFIRKATQLDDALGRLRQEMAERGRISRALEQSEERLRLAMEGAGMGSFDVNLQTGTVLWSATHLHMLGYEAATGRETGIEVWTDRVHPDDRARVEKAREQALRDRSAYAVEYRVRRADNGAVVWLAVFGRYYYDASGLAGRFLGVAFDITRRKELEREAVQREVLAITAREQRQIGQELHDGVGQELTGLGLMAQALTQRLPETADEQRLAQRLAAGLDGVRRQVRELSRGLIPVHVESRGLSAALDDLAARTAETSGVAVTAECPEWVELPDHTTATQLFRIAQEAVRNAVRHGRPRHIRLSLLAEPNGLRLRIRDDGVGIQDAPGRADGLGLRIMQYRAGQIGGDLQIGPSHGGGTVVSCTLPRGNGNERNEVESDPGEGPDRG
jgi:PAS domain S-box-containing protein